MLIFMKSVVIGLCIAAPVGPIGLLCLQRSFTRGWIAGFATGLGAATADALYGFLGALGVTAVITALVGFKPWLCLLGGLFLAYLGYQTVGSKAPSTALAGERANLFKAYATTLLLTLSNPMTILSFIAIFASMSDGIAGDETSRQPVTTMVTGIFLGSAAWWLGLSTVAATFKTRFSPARLTWVNRLCGATLVALGAYQVATGLVLMAS